MPGMRELLAPLAVLASASDRDRRLIASLELAAMEGQVVTLPPGSGRVSARVKRAAGAAQERALAYERHRQAREARRPLHAAAVELLLHGWIDLPAPGEVFLHEQGPHLCLEVLAKAPDAQGTHLLLARPWADGAAPNRSG